MHPTGSSVVRGFREVTRPELWAVLNVVHADQAFQFPVTIRREFSPSQTPKQGPNSPAVKLSIRSWGSRLHCCWRSSREKSCGRYLWALEYSSTLGEARNADA